MPIAFLNEVLSEGSRGRKPTRKSTDCNGLQADLNGDERTLGEETAGRSSGHLAIMLIIASQIWDGMA
jgi:hypothetical protein